jgi:hypothetical protein
VNAVSTVRSLDPLDRRIEHNIAPAQDMIFVGLQVSSARGSRGMREN